MRAIHVWLIHGTFEPNASWIDEAQSPLCAKLRAELGPDIVFHAFHWSGRNRHVDRIQAGEKLRGEILAFKKTNPETTIHIVGHSHGGAVITQALRNVRQLSEVVDSIVFLSTPFIQLLPRVQAVAIGAMLAFFALLCLSGMFYWVSQGDGKNVEELVSRFGSLPFWLKWGALGALAILLLKFGWRVSKSNWEFERWMRNYLGEVYWEFGIANLNPQKTLFIRAQADEASMLLTFVHGLSRLLGEVVGRIAVAFTTVVPLLADRRKKDLPAARSWPRRIEHAIVVVFFIVFLVVATYQSLDLVLSAFGTSMKEQFAKVEILQLGSVSLLVSNLESLKPTIFKFMVTIGGIGLSLMLMSALLFGMLGRAFGRWFFLPGLFLEVSVEPTPPGRWTVHQLSAPNQSDAFVEGHSVYLTHSLSHSDPRAHAEIAQWIKSNATFSGEFIAPVVPTDPPCATPETALPKPA